jgi:hypothetical protein
VVLLSCSSPQNEEAIFANPLPNSCVGSRRMVQIEETYQETITSVRHAYEQKQPWTRCR